MRQRWADKAFDRAWKLALAGLTKLGRWLDEQDRKGSGKG